jgi:hypothetical protein
MPIVRSGADPEVAGLAQIEAVVEAIEAGAAEADAGVEAGVKPKGKAADA